MRGGSELKIVFCKKEPIPTVDDIPVRYKYVSTMQTPIEGGWGWIYLVVTLLYIGAFAIVALNTRHYAKQLGYIAGRFLSAITGIDTSFFSESKMYSALGIVVCGILTTIVVTIIHEGIHIMFTPRPFSDVKVCIWFNWFAVSLRSDCVFSRCQDTIQLIAPGVIFQAGIVAAGIAFGSARLFLILTFLNLCGASFDLILCCNVLKQLPRGGVIYYRYIVEKTTT
jgi:hypothetical protein